jgi:hypothetical protein
MIGGGERVVRGRHWGRIRRIALVATRGRGQLKLGAEEGGKGEGRRDAGY